MAENTVGWNVGQLEKLRPIVNRPAIFSRFSESFDSM
jgi:hypothetical protein